MSRREIPEVARQLMQAKKRIENPENWCQWVSRNGHRMCAVASLGEDAKRTIAFGVLERAAYSLFPNEHLNDFQYGALAAQINDTHGHAAVMAMYDHAISLAIQEANAK